jgi:dihydrofolate reductase
MTIPTLSLIVAVSENNVIGKDDALPWSLPDDLKYFRQKTEGKPVIMGRKCYESIGRPLPNRRNIVVSRKEDLKIEGCEVVGSLEEAVEIAKGDAEEIFVIGGAQIYELALPLAGRLYLTRVHAEIDGDVFFPEVDENEWKEVSREEHDADQEHQDAFTFLVYERRRTS